MRRSSRVRLFVLIGMAALAAGMTAATTQAKTDGAAVKKAQTATTITFAHWNASAQELGAVRALIGSFNRTHSSIKVKEITLDPYPQGMLARFAARKPPDVFYVDSSVFPDWVKQGVLSPIGGNLKAKHFSTKKFYPRLLNGFRYKGQLYGLPKDWSPLALEANTTMLAKAGVTAPKTWTQLSTALQKLKAAGQPPMCLSIDLARILAFMYQNKGGFLNASKTKAIVNSSANASAIGQYLTWLKNGLAQTPAQLGAGWCGEALGKEKASIIFEGNWVTDYMKTTFPSVHWAIYPMIHNKVRGNLGFTVSYSLAKDSKHKSQAMTLIRYLGSQAGMRTWVRASRFLPSRSDVSAPKGTATFLKEAPSTHAWQFAPGFSSVLTTAGNELQAAYEGKESVATALKNIQSAANDALRKGH
jgi:multiple sugar transport system substrate-binding protein